MTAASARSARGLQLRPAVAGLVAAFDHLGWAASFATLIFVGPLAAASVPATWLFLLGSLIPTLILTLDRRLPGPIFANVQHAPIAVLYPALIGAGAGAASFGAGVATVAAILGLTAMGFGAAMLALAAFDLTRVIRLMPYSVSTGFLAASGALLIVAALRPVSPPEGLFPLAWSMEFAGSALAVLLALALLVAARVAPGLGLVSTLALAVLGSAALFHFTPLDAETARTLALLRPEPPRDVPASIAFPDLALVDWGAVQAALPAMGAAILVAIFGCLLNLSGVELILRRQARTRRVATELGLANLALGAAGSSVTYVSVSTAVIGAALGALTRASAYVLCVVAAVSMFFAEEIVSVLPPFLTSGFLIFLGLTILDRWFWSQRHVTAGADWLLTGAIAAVAVVFGMLPAIGLGVVSASVIFAARYARLPAIRATSDLARSRSRVDRGPAQSAYLDQNGADVAIVSLQGVLFFGSARQVTDEVRRILAAPKPPHTVVLDFARVRQIDAAAVEALRALKHGEASRTAHLVAAGATPDVERVMGAAGLFGEAGMLASAPSLDAALERAEDAILAGMPSGDACEDAASALARHLGDPRTAAALLARMERVEVSPGATLIRRGETGADVFVIDEGSLTVQVPGNEGRAVRLRTLQPGALVGEVASYAGTPRTADVIAETRAIVYRLSPDTLASLGHDAPELAAAWHRLIATALADKLRRTTQMLEE